MLHFPVFSPDTDERKNVICIELSTRGYVVIMDTVDSMRYVNVISIQMNLFHKIFMFSLLIKKFEHYALHGVCQRDVERLNVEQL